MLDPFATASRLTPIHQVSLAVLLRAACASMSKTTTTHDRGDRYGPMEWAQKYRMATDSVSWQWECCAKALNWSSEWQEKCAGTRRSIPRHLQTGYGSDGPVQRLMMRRFVEHVLNSPQTRCPSQSNRWVLRCRANARRESVAVRRAAGRLFQMCWLATAKLLIRSVCPVSYTHLTLPTILRV